MSALNIAILILIAPVAIKFLDRAYKSFKNTEIYKDLADEESK